MKIQSRVKSAAPAPPPLDPQEALRHIKTLALAAQDSSDMDMIHEHVRMILALVDKALPRRRRSDRHGD
jgi:hypothetical protein